MSKKEITFIDDDFFDNDCKKTSSFEEKIGETINIEPFIESKKKKKQFVLLIKRVN